MINSLFFIFVISSLIVSAIAYIATANFIVAIILFILFISYYFLYLGRKYHTFQKKIKSVHECYHFCNSLVIALSIKKSLSAAFESIEHSFTGFLKEQVDSLKHLQEIEVLEYLKKYFVLDIYVMFVNIVTLYLDQGGDIILMSDLVIDELRKVEENLNLTISYSRRSLFNFVSMWFLTFGVLVFCRFGIAQFYTEMLAISYFPFLILAFFVFFGFSFHMLFVNYFSLENIGVKREKA